MDLSKAHSCHECRRLVIEARDGDGGKASFALAAPRACVKDAIRGVKSGCVFFRTMTDNGRKLAKLKPHAPLAVEISHYSRLETWSFQIGCAAANTPSSKFHSFESDIFEVYAFEDDPAGAYIRRPVPNLDPGSKASLNRAGKWLSDCQQHHPLCREQSFKEVLPTRLVLVPTTAADDESFSSSSTTSTSDGQVRIVEAQAGDSYAALSYCWGGDQPQKLTKKRLAEGGGVYAAAQLPRTILDAIRVTSSLGIRHLWVDSLCIVQDDNASKDQEIAKMSAIYSNAVLTISAATATSCHEGFLRPRMPEELNRLAFRLPFRKNGGPDGAGAGSISSSKDINRNGNSGADGWLYLASEPSNPDRLVKMGTEPINDRAWTLQEHALSPRILFYSYQQPYWVCREGHHADGGLGPGDHVRIGFRDGVFNLFAINSNSGKQDPEWIPYGFSNDEADRILSNRYYWWRLKWELLLHNYQRRRLSEADDRLVAVSAIGTKFAEYMQTEFVAGLFAHNLPEGLLWARLGPALPRPVARRAPSWSWAAIDSNTDIRACIRGVRLCVTMQIVRWGHNVGGSGRGISIQCHCWLAPAKLLNRGPQERWVVLQKRRKQYCLDVTDLGLDAADPEVDAPAEVDIYLIEVGWYPRQIVNDDRFTNCRVTGLLATRRQQGGSGNEVFRRIGIFNMNTADFPNCVPFDEEDRKCLRRRRRKRIHRSLGFRRHYVTLV